MRRSRKGGKVAGNTLELPFPAATGGVRTTRNRAARREQLRAAGNFPPFPSIFLEIEFGRVDDDRVSKFPVSDARTSTTARVKMSSGLYNFPLLPGCKEQRCFRCGRRRFPIVSGPTRRQIPKYLFVYALTVSRVTLIRAVSRDLFFLTKSCVRCGESFRYPIG